MVKEDAGRTASHSSSQTNTILSVFGISIRDIPCQNGFNPTNKESENVTCSADQY